MAAKFWKTRLFKCALCMIALLPGTYQYSYTGERSIRSAVLSSFAYDRMARPATQVEVHVGLTLMTVIDLDVYGQQLTCTGWLTEIWNDDRLVWNPTLYDDTQYIHAIQGEVWKPELLIDNTMEDVGIIGEDDLIFRIQYTGEVLWEPARLFKVYCAADTVKYPYDTQLCTIELRSWGLKSDELMMYSLQPRIITDHYKENGVWELTGTNVSESTVNITMNGAHTEYSQLVFSVTLQRRTSFYIVHTFVPILVTSSLVVLVFLIPAESGEKMTYSITVLLAILVLMTMYLPHIPDSNAHIAVYLKWVMCYAGGCSILSAVVLAMHHRPSAIPVGTIHRIVLLGIKYLTFWTFPTEPEIETDDDDLSLYDLPTDNLKKIQRPASGLKNNSIKPELEDGFTEHETYATPKSAKSLNFDPRIFSAKMGHNMGSEPYTKNNKRDKKGIDLKWTHAATLWDRLLFLLALSGTIYYNVYFVRKITE